MASLSYIVYHYAGGGTKPAYSVTGIKRINVKLGSKADQNEIELLLRNDNGEQLDSSGELRFKLDDRIKIWVKYDETNAGINTSSTDDLLIFAEVKEAGIHTTERMQEVKVVCADRTFTVLNRLHVQDYVDTPAPNIIQSIIRTATQHSTSNSQYFKTDGTMGGTYEIDARLENDASPGYIEDRRPDGSVFPNVNIAKVFKPAYEWISDLSTTTYTNTPDELDSTITTTPVVPRSMLFYLDEQNRFHWFYPSTTASIAITEGATAAVSPDTVRYYVYGVNLTNKVFDVINFIIYDAGTDMNGNNILGFVQDETKGKPNVKDSYRPMVKISLNMKEQDRKAGYITKNTDGSYNYPASYPLIPKWDHLGRSVSNDADYNSHFQEEAQWRAEAACKYIINQTSGARWKGNIDLRGYKFIPTDLLNFNSVNQGILNQKLRIQTVQHTIDKNGWYTSLQVEEDQSSIGVI